jgi:hypothetical protein
MLARISVLICMKPKLVLRQEVENTGPSLLLHPPWRKLALWNAL